jgi:hypothetical protein
MEAEYRQPEDIITDYLDYLCAPLVGVVPFEQRTRLREETLFHLEELVEAYQRDGHAPMEAARHAVYQYGESHEVGQLFLETWFAHQPQGKMARILGLANLRTLIPFGIATLFATALVQMRVFMPNPEPMTFGLSMAQIRQVLPEPLPLPDASPLSVLLALTMLIAPWIAGFYTGAMVPVRPARAVYSIMTLLIIYTFVLGVLLLPTHEGLIVGIIQVFYWLPIGCLSAQTAAIVTWRRRCRFMLVSEPRFRLVALRR